MTYSAKRRRAARRPLLAPYLFLTPAIVLFVLFLAVPIGYTAYLAMRRTRVSGLGLGGRVAARGVRRVRQLRRRDHRRRAVGRVAAGARVRRDRAGRDAGAGARVRAGPGLGPGAAGPLRPDRDLPAVRGARRGRVAAVGGFLYLPSLSPIRAVLDVDLLGATTVTYSMANVAVWGGTGFNMLVLYTALRAVPRDYYEAARLDGATETQIALRIKIPLLMPSDHPDHRVLDHRDDPGVHRADHAAAVHEHDQLHVEPADEGLPGRVRHR
ncbi:carbohydrate ABC transporter permease [Nonomuraea ferruginea]